jgi:hypothetical protein
MAETYLKELNSLVDALVATGQPPDSVAFAKMSETLARVFGVDPDEVAILAINSHKKHLTFVIPEKLAVVGSIPLTSTNALAARTARERRAELANNFSSSRHSSVFEGIPLGRRQGELIQKIMSAPILDGGRAAGVVQISRKGRTPSLAGPDFTQKELHTLASLAPVLNRFLALCAEA